MFRLVDTDFASTGKADLCNRALSGFLDFRVSNVLGGKGGHLGPQVFAHEIELVRTIFIGRVKCGLSRRKREDQPAMSRIDRFESEYVAEVRAVRVGIFTVNNYAST
jgi:hypothetical protein